VSAMRRTLAAAAAAAGGGGGGGLPSSAAQVGASRRIVDYMPFLSLTSVRRQPSPIRSLQPYMDTPGMISLGGGMPNASFFPIAGLEVRLVGGTVLPLVAADVSSALQYSSSYGITEFVQWLKAHQTHLHHPPYASEKDWNVCVTTGSSDANAKAFEMLINPGDHVLVENPTYSGSLAALRPLGCTLVGLPTDHEGLSATHLRSLLSSWPSERPKPKVLYLIPTGQNPSGATLPEERRREIYAIAQQYNLLILEDDPYFHLQLDTKEGDPPLRSFFSMDVDGRVLRFDSFSKIISSGLRIGWATGPAPLIERIQLHQQASTLHVSGLSQTILLKLLKHWGDDGLKHHITRVQEGYRKRRDLFCSLAEKHLRGLAEWHPPSAGMFVWFKILGIQSSEKLIKEKALEQKVLLVPGVAFTPNGEDSPFVRASFSTATPEEMDEALRRFAALLRSPA